MIDGNRPFLAQALANLIDNAIDFSPANGMVEVQLQAQHEGLRIEVKDRGPGIPVDEIERLKRPFTRLDNARSNVEGTGLGLAIVERVIRMHNGRFELSPRPDGGLIARLCIPMQGHDEKKPQAHC